MVGDQPVHQMPSANIAIAFNEIDKLGQTPKTDKIRAYLMATQVQVNDFRNPPPSHSTTSNHSQCSRRDRRSQHRATECPQHQGGGPYPYEGPRGNYEANSRNDGHPPRPQGGQGGNHRNH